MQSVLADLVTAETLHSLSAVTIWGVVLAATLVWVTLNVYQFYPLLQTLVIDADTDDTDTVHAPGIGNDGYPEIDVFVPGSASSDAIEQSLAAITDSTYPLEKLHIYVLTEPGDQATRAALERLREAYPFAEGVVPEDYPGEPNTPRALNFAFDVTTSELVAVVDPADRVGERFFEQAAGTLVETDCSYALGRLDVVDEGDCWLDAQVRAEFATWYGKLLPAFQRLDYPVPLTGTTCVFTRNVLKRAAAERIRRFGDPWSGADTDWLAEHAGTVDGTTPWNPNSVTEDFELGLLLWAFDEECRYCGVVTREASPHTFHTWLRQRTRSQRGKLDALVQHLGHPRTDHEKMVHLVWQAGLPYLGAINVVALLAVASRSVLGYPVPSGISSLLFAGTTYAGLAILLAGYGYWQFSDDRSRRRASRAVVIAITLPVYWLLQAIVDLRTLAQLYLGHSRGAKAERKSNTET